MRPEFYKELGISPIWREKARLQQEQYIQKKVSVLNKTINPTVSIKKLQWLPLREKVKNCTLCELHQQRQNTVFGVGNQQPDVFIVGEGPGREEDIKGEPFVGEAGKLLDEILYSIKLSRRQSIYISNIVKCRPPNNRVPTTAEVTQCMPYLERQIELAQPKLIVALGKTATTHLLQDETSISQLRQKLHDYKGIPLIATYHPAYLLRNPLEKRKMWEDCCFICNILKGEED